MKDMNGLSIHRIVATGSTEKKIMLNGKFGEIDLTKRLSFYLALIIIFCSLSANLLVESSKISEKLKDEKRVLHSTQSPPSIVPVYAGGYLYASGFFNTYDLIEDSNGTLHVAYTTVSSTYIHYGVFNGSYWNTTFVGNGDEPSISIDQNGIIRIAYYNLTNKDLEIKSFDGLTWGSKQILDSLGDVGRNANSVIDSNNNLHIIYVNDQSTSLRYTSFDGTSWSSPINLDYNGLHYFDYVSVDIDSSDNIHISYRSTENYELKYVSKIANSWTTPVVIDDNGYVGKSSSIAVDNNGNVSIIHLDNQTGEIKYNQKINGNWIGNQSTNQPIMNISDCYSTYDLNDNLHVFYTDSNQWQLWHASYDGQTWRYSGIIASNWWENRISVLFNSSNYLHVAGAGIWSNAAGYSIFEIDSDNDSIGDSLDAFPFDSSEATDSDNDGIGNNADIDDDNDGTPDEIDDFPLDPNEDTDTDFDGVGNNADNDDDDDGLTDAQELTNCSSPLNPDTDGDGLTDYEEVNGLSHLNHGEPTDPCNNDTDGDGWSDFQDAFPNDPSEFFDGDGDGVGDNSDAFPNDNSETNDTDGDGVGDNADWAPTDANETTDSDGDGVGDNSDAFPSDASETTDTDGDGVGDNADWAPTDANETTDSDGDGVGDNADWAPTDANETTDSDGDGVGDNSDAFPSDASETTDSDGDGVGDNSDSFPSDASETLDSDGDGVEDNSDAFPFDNSETTDSDGDGMGDNSDSFPSDASETLDSDGDGMGDNSDSFPSDASETLDSDGDGVGDNSDAFPFDNSETTDSDGDGVGDNSDAFPLDPINSSNQQTNDGSNNQNINSEDTQFNEDGSEKFSSTTDSEELIFTVIQNTIILLVMIYLILIYLNHTTHRVVSDFSTNNSIRHKSSSEEKYESFTIESKTDENMDFWESNSLVDSRYYGLILINSKPKSVKLELTDKSGKTHLEFMQKWWPGQHIALKINDQKPERITSLLPIFFDRNTKWIKKEFSEMIACKTTNMFLSNHHPDAEIKVEYKISMLGFQINKIEIYSSSKSMDISFVHEV
jgi:hypothetical protein